MSQIASTVPGAVGVLLGYMEKVAKANPSINAGVYFTDTTSNAIKNNFMMLGSYPDGVLFAPNTYDWAALPAQTMMRSESYSLLGCIRAWSGDSGQVAALQQLSNAMAMLNGLQEQMLADPQGSSTLSDSGSWGSLVVSVAASGPFGDKGGWGILLNLEIQVINVRLYG